MHFDFIAEGWKPDLEAFESWLNTRTFSMPAKDKNGNDLVMHTPAALRIRKAYTYVFPRAHLQAVINSLNPERAIGKHDGKGTPILNMPAQILRKGLKLKKFPDADPKGLQFPLVKKNIRILGLGYRDDIDITKDGLTYEGL